MIKIIVEQDKPIFGDIREGFMKKCEWTSHWESSFDDVLDMLMEAANVAGFHYIDGDYLIRYGMELNEEENVKSKYDVFYADEKIDNE